MQETIKMVFAVMMTAVLACTGTYVMMNDRTEGNTHIVLEAAFPVLDLGDYMPNDLMDSSSPIVEKELARFGSFSEFSEFQKKYGNEISYSYFNNGMDGGAVMEAGASADSSSASGANYQTNTNIQVAGVDEGDIVKNDGQYAYVISGTGQSVFIIRAYPAEEAHILSEINSSGTFIDLYIWEDKLVMLEQVYYFEGGFQRNSYQYSQNPFVNVKVFDVTNRSAPVLVDEAASAGNYLTSRLIDGTLYLIGNQYMLACITSRPARKPMS